MAPTYSDEPYNTWLDTLPSQEWADFDRIEIDAVQAQIDDERHWERQAEPYCDLCEREGHTFRSCPTRDDNELWDEA